MIGIASAVFVSPWLIVLVAVGTSLALAYNLELFGGRFHTDMWFAVAWGGFPAFTGWLPEALDVRTEGLLVTFACCLISVAQRRLSTAARELRRRTISVTGWQTLRDRPSRALDLERMHAPLEGALDGYARARCGAGRGPPVAGGSSCHPVTRTGMR